MIGIGNSSGDIAVELSRVCEKVTNMFFTDNFSSFRFSPGSNSAFIWSGCILPIDKLVTE